MVDFDRWKRIEHLFMETLEQEEQDRESFLEHACAGDEGLKAEVERLMQLDADRNQFVDGSVGALAMSLLSEAEDEPLLGAKVGAFRLTEVLGRGGMGTVYRATREGAEFEQDVAVKILRRGVDSEDVVRRFKRERTLLARLDHPGIARLIDGGSADDGRPFIAMEFVPGEDITGYCDSRRLGIDDRLRLFESVCDIVQFAHRNLIVHRDLKPSNILVIDRESGPEVKLLDFGIAKLLESEEGLASITSLGPGPLTPEYAAPEQISGEPVSTSTDIYALGLLLYELVTGRRPFQLPGKSRKAAEQALRESAPTRPSTLLSSTGEEGHRLAERRGETRERLQRRLRGDIDLICLMALRREPERRYSSACDLADDVRRHRTGHTVSAQPDSALYTMSKIASRNRSVVLTMGVALVLLIGAVIFYTLRLQQERDRASREAEKAMAVQSFMLDIFGSADPDVSRGETLTALDILEQGKRQAASLSNRPDLQAEVLVTLAYVYESLAEYESANDLVDEALAVLRASPKSQELGLVDGLLRKASILSRLGNFRAAEDSLNTAAGVLLDMPRNQVGDLDIRVTMEKAWVMESLSRYEEALVVLEDVLNDIERRHAGPTDLLATAQKRLSSIHYSLGNDSLAVRYAREGLATFDASGEPSVSSRLVHLNALGIALDEVEDWEGARDTYEEALSIAREVLGMEHHTTTNIQHNLAYAYFELDRFALADSMMRVTLDMETRRLGPDHFELIATHANLGIFSRQAGQLDESELQLRESLRIAALHFDPPHYLLGAVQLELAETLLERGAFEQADSSSRDGIEQLTAVLGAQNYEVTDAILVRANVLKASGDCANANQLIRDRLAFVTDAEQKLLLETTLAELQADCN